jgi:sugar lactone lactonase YvrE
VGFNRIKSALATIRIVHIFNTFSTRLVTFSIAMKKAAITPDSFVLLLLTGLCFGSCSSCRNETPTDADGSVLNPPTVFIPVGVLKTPGGIAVDADNNVWVSDSGNDRLRKFSSTGILADSIVLMRPSAVALDKATRSYLVVVENGTTISRFALPGKTLTTSYPLHPFTGNSSTVFDVGLNMSVSLNIVIRHLGDVDTSPTGDMFVAAQGSPANSVIRISSGGISALAASTVDSANAIARFLAVDGFGSAYTSFSLNRGPAVVPTIFSLAPGNILQSRSIGTFGVSGRAQGAAIDAAGRMYITDQASQELVIISTVSETILGRYSIPDVNGFAMIPRDVALANDGTVYIVVNDRLGTEAGAVLKYTRRTS